MIISAAGFGLIVGCSPGLVGGGGSILAVPALVYGVGLPLAAAIPTSLVVVGASSAVAVLPRLRSGVNWRLALIIGAAGTLTAYLGAMVNRLLDQKILLLAFADHWCLPDPDADAVQVRRRLLRASGRRDQLAPLPSQSHRHRRLSSDSMACSASAAAF